MYEQVVIKTMFYMTMALTIAAGVIAAIQGIRRRRNRERAIKTCGTCSRVNAPAKGVYATHIPTDHTVRLEIEVEGGQGNWIAKDLDSVERKGAYRIVNVEELKGFYIDNGEQE